MEWGLVLRICINHIAHTRSYLTLDFLLRVINHATAVNPRFDLLCLRGMPIQPDTLSLRHVLFLHHVLCLHRLLCLHHVLCLLHVLWLHRVLCLHHVHNVLSRKFQPQEVRRGSDYARIFSVAFSRTCSCLAVSSDKGTVHVFSLNGAVRQVQEGGTLPAMPVAVASAGPKSA